MNKLKFKIGDLVLLNVLKDKKGNIVASTSGLIRNVKQIDGRSILQDYNVYYVEIEGKGLEWINERYLTKA